MNRPPPTKSRSGHQRGPHRPPLPRRLPVTWCPTPWILRRLNRSMRRTSFCGSRRIRTCTTHSFATTLLSECSIGLTRCAMPFVRAGSTGREELTLRGVLTRWPTRERIRSDHPPKRRLEGRYRIESELGEAGWRRAIPQVAATARARRQGLALRGIRSLSRSAARRSRAAVLSQPRHASVTDRPNVRAFGSGPIS